VKLDGCCDPISIGTLTRVKSIEYVCECVFATDCAKPAIVDYSFILLGRIGSLHDKSP
jgi:hypothetical protein